MSESSLALSSVIFLSGVASLGVILYTAFAYLVTSSKNTEVKRCWRYSILWGVSFDIFTSILFDILSILALLGGGNELGYMSVFRSPSNPLELFIEIVLFLVYPVLISLPLVFLITLGTYWKELQNGDLLINQLVYPIKKHPSGQYSNSVFDQMRIFITRLID